MKALVSAFNKVRAFSVIVKSSRPLVWSSSPYTGHLMDDPLLSLDNAATTMEVEKITTQQNTSSNCSACILSAFKTENKYNLQWGLPSEVFVTLHKFLNTVLCGVDSPCKCVSCQYKCWQSSGSGNKIENMTWSSKNIYISCKIRVILILATQVWGRGALEQRQVVLLLRNQIAPTK